MTSTSNLADIRRRTVRRAPMKAPKSKMPPKNGLKKPVQGEIWWSNAIFFVSIHLFTLLAIPFHLPSVIDLVLCLASSQLATYGITMGYHRLWSHRAYVATTPLRIVLAAMGCLGFQGSIRWWVLRHRIHHRWTDTDDDPYDSSKGLWFSHVGWIFRKPSYAKMNLIDRRDLDADPVVRFQHKHYIPLTLALGFGAPTVLAPVLSSYFPSLSVQVLTASPSTSAASQAFRGLLYGGFLARLIIWHMTFLINSFAHWCGERAYARDISARGNFLLALFTGGEANHNYHHVFPKDYRNGPAVLDWDPTKWLIYFFHKYTPLIPKVYAAAPDEVEAARQHVLTSSASLDDFFKALAEEPSPPTDDEGDADADTDEPRYDSGYGTKSSSSEREDDPGSASPGPRRRKLARWPKRDLRASVAALEPDPTKPAPLVLLIEGYAVDVTAFALTGEHPGGLAVLSRFAIKPAKEPGEDGAAEGEVPDATKAFFGGLNAHQWPARRRMRMMRIAKVVDDDRNL